MARPGQVFGDHGRLVAFDHTGKAFQMGRINALFGPDRQANPVNGQREFVADRGKRTMGGTAVAHVVLRVNFKEPDPVVVGENGIDVVGLQTRSRTWRERAGRKTRVLDNRRFGGGLRHFVFPVFQMISDQAGRSRSSGSSEPMRPPSTLIVVQVPASTVFQALP
jgi:hypothetical protein